MKLRTDLFSLAVLALVVPSALMLIAAPGGPAPEFVGDVRWGSSAALLPDGGWPFLAGAVAQGRVSAPGICSMGQSNPGGPRSTPRGKPARLNWQAGPVL